MKFLIFITQFYQISGAEKLAIDLAKNLATRNINVHILSMYSKDIPGVKPVADELEHLGIAISYLGLPINASPLTIIAGIARFRKFINSNNFTAIEASSIGPQTICALATIGIKVPILCGIHAIFERRMHNSLKQKIWRYAMKFRTGLRFYAISHAVANAWNEYIGLKSNSVPIIYNSISEEFFTVLPESEAVRSELAIPANSKIILFVGSLMRYKGIDILYNSIGPILEENNCYLVLIGEGNKAESFYPADKSFYIKLDEQIKNSSWSSRVKFLGNRKDVARIMASSTVLAHPTRTEGFGLVLVEALAAGLPVAATKVGGIPEVLEGTKSILVPSENPKAMQTAILDLLKSSPSDRQEMISIGRMRAANFTTTKRVDEIIKLASH